MSDTKKWLQERVMIVLTRDEMFELANAVADASRSDVEFTKVKDRRIRKMFRESIEKRHVLWRKVTTVAEEAVVEEESERKLWKNAVCSFCGKEFEDSRRMRAEHKVKLHRVYCKKRGLKK